MYLIKTISSYLTTEENANTISLDKKNILFKEVIPIIYTILFDLFKVQYNKVGIIGSGTQYVIFSFETTNAIYAFEKLKTNTKINGPHGDFFPKNMILKVQIFSTKNNYEEKKILRHESIIKRLNNIHCKPNTFNSIIRDAIPQLYFGCTYSFNTDKFRLTFMEFINPNEYITVQNLLAKPECTLHTETYEMIEKLIKALCKLNISHNDLSVRNILVGTTIQTMDKVKLLDFGLSEMFNKDFSYEYYNSLFENSSIVEQRCHNIKKLRDLCVDLYRRVDANVDKFV
jgi:tRNA A-37 threonylcarbamoyl transferase component Bud32